MTEAGQAEPLPGGRDTFRLFFALWPDDATRDALSRTGKWLHRHWGGRRMRADTLHMTLVFLGSTPAAELEALAACAAAITREAFELILDRPGYWSYNRIGWLGASKTPPQYLELARALNGALAAAGFAVDARPHVPHVTLLRKSAGGEAPVCSPVRWRVADFVLVKSVTAADGAHYEVIGRWPLGSGVGASAP